MAGGIDEDDLMLLLDKWDDVSAAIDRVVTALPGQMTAAAENLEHQRKAMRGVIIVVTRKAKP